MDYAVTVKIVRVRALTPDIDNVTPPDMYAKIRIGSDQHKTGHKKDDADVSPTNWSHSVSFTDDDFTPPKKVPIRIQLWDKDTWLDEDDRIDINPAEDSSLELRLSFDTGANTVGDRAGVLYLPDGTTEVPNSVLRRVPDVEGRPNWESGTVNSRGCDGDRAEMWFKVQVEAFPLV